MRSIFGFYFRIRRILGSAATFVFLSCAVITFISVMSADTSNTPAGKPTDESAFEAIRMLSMVAGWLLSSFYVKWSMIQEKTESVLLPVLSIVSLLFFFMFCLAAQAKFTQLSLDGIILYVWLAIDIIEASRIYSFTRSYCEYGYFTPYYV